MSVAVDRSSEAARRPRTLTGKEGRASLYALAAALKEPVFAFSGTPQELRALAERGGERSGAEPVRVVRLQDATAFADSIGRLRWRRVPAGLFVDGTGVDPDTLDRIREGLSTVAPLVVAVGE